VVAFQANLVDAVAFVAGSLRVTRMRGNEAEIVRGVRRLEGYCADWRARQR
jgi:hypothetical protein